MAEVVIAKPDSHRREYAFLELENGLKAVIGSDPLCDKAGAALCVNVGMCHERKDLPGLAHFLEHMLFTGTTKYPKEGEYHEFIQQNGGRANAYTTCYFTNYMFEVKPEAMETALDRFSRFFTEPLLTKDCTDREINAVDSEFQGGSTQPWWRYVGIMNMSANPEHPFHVAVGNNKVLRDEPKARGVDLYEEMTKLYHSCYSANGMALCLFGKEDINTLKALVKEKFGGVVNKGVTMPIGDAVSDKPPFLKKDWNRLLLQTPVKDVKELSFSWVIPFQGPFWKSKPTAYISHLLGHEGEGSIIAVLKRKGLISGCSSGDGAWLEGAFSLMNVSFDLTDLGQNHIDEIGQHLFAFIGLLQKTAVEKWIFDEMSNLRKIQFRFSEDRQPFDLTPDVALSLLRHPPSEAFAGEVLMYEYDPEAIASIIAMLKLDAVRVTHQAKSLADRCTEKDTSYDSPMAFLPIEESWLKLWGDALTGPIESVASAMGLHLPKPNPFIPEDLALKELPSNPPSLPTLIEGAPAPIACIFHRQDDAFRQPKALLNFQIYSPFVNRDVSSYVKTELWCQCIDEALNEYTYDATIAGVSYNLGIGKGCLSLTFAGFHDKLGVLLEAVTTKMRSLTEIPENIFSIVTDAYGDDIRNQAFHSHPYTQCGMRFNEIATKGMSFPAYKRLEAFQTLKREDLTGMAASIFQAVHVEAIALGNLKAEDARRMAETLVAGLQLKSSVPLERLPERAEAKLLAGSTVWRTDSTDKEDPNHCVFMRLQMPEGMESEMMMQVVSKVLGPKFFDILRTQQQLGYIVQMGCSPSAKFCYMIALVQTEFEPNYARSRIDNFFDEHFLFIEEKLTVEEFDICRQGLISELQVKPKNLSEEFGRYSRHFTERTNDFGRRIRAIEFVKGLTLETFRAFVREKLSSAPRIYNQVKKVLSKEDKALPEGASIPSDPATLRCWRGHLETVAAWTPQAEWVPMKSDVAVSIPVA